MGRALLIAAAAATLLSGCEVARPPAPAQTAAAIENGHEDLACAACHNGEKTEKSRASVTREACTASGCHEDAGPPKVTLATAEFEHRNHAAQSEITVNCAGCHTHDAGAAPLRASVDACALCHGANLAGKSSEECQLCHKEPKHVAMTSQGIPVAHSSLPWLETGCARCHFDVMQPQKKVAMAKCLSCHEQGHELTKEAIAQDLHPTHRGVTCTSCHEAGLHKVAEMSSAVALNCADCHTRDHNLATTRASTETCAACHKNAHQAQQRMVLGIVGDGRVMPSAKFLTGATCRSCHAPPQVRQTVSDEPRRGQAEACAGCHDVEYNRVLDWWLDGSIARERKARAYVDAARAALPAPPDSARRLLARATRSLDLVRTAGGQHNLELADLIYREAVSQAAAAYEVAGRAPRALPDFGNVPHVGTCSFCHYGSAEPWNYRAMPQALHERLTRERTQ
jgi:hypothetical protein